MRLMELDCNDIDHTFIKRTKTAWAAAAAFSAGPSISLRNSETWLRCCCRVLNKGAQTQTGDLTTRRAPAPGRWRNLNACIALLAPVLTLAGCIGPTLLSSQRSITVESLEGNYRRLALCTYERLNRKDGRLRIVDSSDQDRVKIDFDPGSSQHWDLSFINEDPGRLTRVEITLPRISEGSFPREHALATARACAA